MRNTADCADERGRGPEARRFWGGSLIRNLGCVGAGTFCGVECLGREVSYPSRRGPPALRAVFLPVRRLRGGRALAIWAPMLAGFEAVTERIIGCAIEVHRHTGPIIYKSEALDCAFRIDFVVERSVLVEVKSRLLRSPTSEPFVNRDSAPPCELNPRRPMS